MKLQILLLVVMLGIVGRVDAAYYTGNDILMLCESKSMHETNQCAKWLCIKYCFTGSYCELGAP